MGTTNASSYRTGMGISWLSRGAFALAALTIAGCTSDRSEEGGDDAFNAKRDDVSEEALSPNALSPNALSPNALSPNALSPNALSPNALSPNALSPNALSPNALSPNALSPLANPGAVGDLSRQLLKFTVGCALTPEQSFTLDWTGEMGEPRTERYVGILGLAPSWVSGPLDTAGQRWVSACLAARTNRYGVTVMLSLRGNTAPLGPLTEEESTAYPHLEGAFWGNLFSATPYLHACYTKANADNSRAQSRDCAAGQVSSGATGAVECANIAIVGECADLCTWFTKSGGFYSSCVDPTAPDGAAAQMITSALP